MSIRYIPSRTTRTQHQIINLTNIQRPIHNIKDNIKSNNNIQYDINDPNTWTWESIINSSIMLKDYEYEENII